MAMLRFLFILAVITSSGTAAAQEDLDNPLNRYSIGDRTAGLKQGADGSLEIYMQTDNPGPERESNWLPAPGGPFFFVGRFYGPKQEALDGT